MRLKDKSEKKNDFYEKINTFGARAVKIILRV